MKRFYGTKITEEMLIPFYGLESKTIGHPGSNTSRVVKRPKNELEFIRTMYQQKRSNATTMNAPETSLFVKIP